MANYNLPNTATFEEEIDSTNDIATLGTASESGIMLGSGNDTVFIGAAGQIAIAGVGAPDNTANVDVFVLGTDGSASNNVVADSAAGQVSGTNLVGGPGNNAIAIEGGTSGGACGAVILDNLDTPEISNNINYILVDNSSTYLIANDEMDYRIVAGNGDDSFDLRESGATTQLTAGNGNDGVFVGNDHQIVSLGSGTNFVFDNDLDVKSIIDGGSGASNTLVIETTIAQTMGSGVIGFETVVLDVEACGRLVTNLTDDAGSAVGLVVDGSSNGGDVVTLRQANQSYDGDFQYSTGSTLANHVTLDGGTLNAGVTLDGGSQAGSMLSTLELKTSGVFDFTSATVKDFAYVDVDAAGTSLTLNSGSYLVDVEAVTGNVSGTPVLVTDSLIGGSGSNKFEIMGTTTSSPEVFTSGSVVNGGSGATETLEIGCGANVDLSQATLSNLTSIVIDPGSSLTLTSDQIAALDAAASARGQDPSTLISDCSPTTLVVDMSSETTTLNVASLNLYPYEITDGGVVEVVANSSNDTIYGGPGNETIVVGSGKDWINAGSGNDTIVVGPSSGSGSVLIGGDAGHHDTFEFGTTSTSTFVTNDIIVGPTFGSATVEVVVGTVDFTTAGTENVSASTTIQIDSDATAIFTIGQIAGLHTLSVGIGGLGTLEIEATISGSNVITQAELDGFSGDVVVDASGFSSNSSLPGVTIDVSGLTGNVTVEGESSFWTGAWTIDGGAATTVVFDNPGGLIVTQFNSLHGDGGEYTLDIQTDLNAATSPLPLISGSASSVDIAIAQGVTFTVNAAQISGPAAGGVLFNSSVNPTTDAHFVIQDTTGSFLQSSVTILDDVGTNSSNNPFNFDETINVSYTSAATINLTNPIFTADNMLTIDVNILSSASDTILAGIGSEDLQGGAGNDTFSFDIAPSGTVALLIDDTINGGLGTNLLTVGDGSTIPVLVFDNFDGSTITGVQTEDIYSSATAIFYSSQVDSTTANVSGTLVIHAAEASNLFSLVQSPTGHNSVNANLTLSNTGGEVVTIDNMTGTNTIYAGAGAEAIYDGQQIATLNAGTGHDTLFVRDGGGGVDNLFGNGATGSAVVFDFTYDGGTSSGLMSGVVNAPLSHWADGSSASTVFDEENGSINVNGATSASILIDHNTDLSGASITGLLGSTTMTVDGSNGVVLKDTQLEAFHTASVTSTTGSGSLVVDDTAGGTYTTAGLNLTDWSGSVTIDAASQNVTVDASGLLAGTFLDSEGGHCGGVYIYGSAGDTILTPDAPGDYIQGFGGGTKIEFEGGSDATLLAGGGNSNTVIFEVGAATATGDVIHGGGGLNETLQVEGTTDFSGAVTNGIQAFEDVFLDNLATGTVSATLTSAEIVHDQLTSKGPLEVTDNLGTTADAIFQVTGTGNIDLSKVVDTGFGANIAGGGSATIDIVDTNATSVTVIGTNNGVATSTETEAGDNITVAGHGDTVIVGTGANLVTFAGLNVANDVTFNFSALNTGDATSPQSLGAMGNLVIGLNDGHGYADIAGYNLASSAVNATPVSGLALDGANGFSKYGVIEDSFVVSGNPFIASGNISGSGVGAAALNIEGNFTDSTHALEKGFITVTDTANDVALFYVHTTGAGASNEVAAADIHLVGVFQNAHTLGVAGELSSSFFNVH